MNQTKFARMLGCTPQRVSQLKALGMPGCSSYGPGRDSYVDVGEAVPWLMNNGYLLPKDGAERGTSRETSRRLIDALWDSWDEAALEISEAYEIDLAVAADMASLAFICADSHLRQVADVPNVRPEWVCIRLAEMASDDPLVVSDLIQLTNAGPSDE